MPRRSSITSKAETCIREAAPPASTTPPRHRGASQDARRSRKRDDSETKERRRRKSTGSIAEKKSRKKKNRPVLRVRTQFQSLKRDGLHAKGNGNNVEFAYLEVREFPMVLGDNPACTEGPPVTIDWAHDPHTQFVLDVNTFERMRGARRLASELVVPKHIREKWLLKTGSTKKEIVEVIRQIRKEKHSRMVSCHNQNYDNVTESVEKVTSGLKKLFVFKKTKYEQSVENACGGPTGGGPTTMEVPMSKNMHHALSA